MIDHVGLKVSSLAKSREFYRRALAPLGYAVDYEDTESGTAGLGAAGATDLWLIEGEPVAHTHVSFRSADRAAVDAFHAAALRAGGRDNRPPGLRADYGPAYYAAFVLDPDGHNVELVCHAPASSGEKR